MERLLCFALLLGSAACARAPLEAPVEHTAPDDAPAARSALPSAPTLPSPTGGCRMELQVGDAWLDRGAIGCGEGGALRLLLTGDVGEPGRTLQATVEGARGLCAERGCDLGLMAGDLLYGDGREASARWPQIWDRGLATLQIPFAAVLGNHEWRHEPNPHMKRQAVFGSDGRGGLIAPGPSYAMRVRDPAGRTLLAIAGLDTDSLAAPAGASGASLGLEALDAVCAEGAPVVWLGHHPPSSQGLHHGHEAHVEAALRALLIERVRGGCRIALAAAGHDHDLQAWGPSCEEAGTPGVVVAGPSARGFREAGPTRHLQPCPHAPDAAANYHAGASPDGGFAWIRVHTTTGATEVALYSAHGGGAITLASTATWSPPAASTE